MNVFVSYTDAVNKFKDALLSSNFPNLVFVEDVNMCIAFILLSIDAVYDDNVTFWLKIEELNNSKLSNLTFPVVFVVSKLSNLLSTEVEYAVIFPIPTYEDALISFA